MMKQVGRWKTWCGINTIKSTSQQLLGFMQEKKSYSAQPDLAGKLRPNQAT